MLILTGDIVREVAKSGKEELAIRDFLNRVADELNNALSAYRVSTCHVNGEDFLRVERLTGVEEGDTTLF